MAIETYLTVAVIVLVGLMVGSFLNVLIGRYEELETILLTRSHCPRCLKLIAWYDLFPLLSFVLLRARCRHCHDTISWQYPLIEALTVVIALALYSQFGLTAQAGLYFVIFSLLLVIAVIDLYDYVIPDEFALTAIVLSFIAAFSFPGVAASLPLWGVLLSGGVLAFLALGSRERWMGAGDISLGVILGLLSGLAGSVVGLVVAFMLGTLVGLLLMALNRKKAKDMIPFGPFLAIGIFVAALWGTQLANWYLKLVQYY